MPHTPVRNVSELVVLEMFRSAMFDISMKVVDVDNIKVHLIT